MRHRLPSFVRCGDVQEDKLICSLLIVFRRKLPGNTSRFYLLEFYSFYSWGLNLNFGHFTRGLVLADEYRKIFFHCFR